MKKLLCMALALLLLAAACALPSGAPGQIEEGEEEMEESIIKLELYPDKAPETVANFVKLAEEGFYDGLIFHRTSPTFMIQGGCPDGKGTGGPGYAIKGEFAVNGFPQNDISHERGVISMARGGHSYDSAGSQFFICVVDYPYLDGEYAAFGRVTEGIELADEIAAGPNTGGQEMRALEPRTMEKVTAETVDGRIIVTITIAPKAA